MFSSKDASIRFWDSLSGLSIASTNTLGEVTSLDIDSSGLYLVAATKGNLNRLWDLRMVVMSMI